jgi:tetratricopeptide (TPR) repeat protein
MRKYIVIAALVLVCSVLALIMLPDSSEMALMQYRDKRFENAKLAYERHLREDTLDVDTARSLTDLYLQYGAVDDAILVMERFVEENPNDIEALKQLGKLYQYAQRPDDYLKTLELVIQLEEENKEKNIAKIVQMYDLSEQYEEQTEALEELTESEKTQENTPYHYRYLAGLHASDGKREEAIASLRRLKEDFPEEFVVADLELLVGLLLESGQQQAAFDAASQNAEVLTEAEEIARITNRLHYAGSPDLGWNFLSLYGEQSEQLPELMVEKAFLHLSYRREDEAYALMQRLYSRNEMPSSIYRQYLFLAMERGDYDVSADVLERMDFSSLTEREALETAEIMVLQRKSRLYAALIQKMEQAGLSDRYASMKAVMRAIERKAGVQDALQEAFTTDLDNGKLLQMAYIFAETRHPNAARQTLQQLQMPLQTRSFVIRAAEIYLAIREPQTAALMVEPLSKQQPDDKELQWLRLRIAAATGDTPAIRQWLANRSDISKKQYEELYFSAHDLSQFQTAKEIARGYYDAYPDEQSRSILVSSYMLARDYEAALPLLREAKSHSEASRNDYLSVLMKLAARNPQYNAELIDFAARELQNPSVPERQKQTLIYALLDAGRGDLALPHIRTLALTRGGDWPIIYTENLDKAGKYEQANAFRAQLAADPKTPAKLRREMGFALLDRGRPDLALTAFARLASEANPQDSDIKQLLYIWGPRLSENQLDWLAYRAVNAPTLEEQDSWLRYVVDFSDASSLIAFMDRSPEFQSHPMMLERYINALHQEDEKLRAEDFLTAQIQETENIGKLRLLARAAKDNEFPRHALAAYQKLEQLTGGDMEAQRNIGISAYTMADYSEVSSMLAPYTGERVENDQYHKDDYQAFFYLAEAHRRDQRKEEAEAAYRQVIYLVEHTREPTSDHYSKLAQAYMMVGEEAKGIEIFEDRIARRPDDLLMRADYIGSLIEIKRYEQAQALLQEVPKDEVAADQAFTPVHMQQVATPMYVSAGKVTGYRSFAGGREMMLEFDNSSEELQHFERHANERDYPWLNYAARSYDRVLISAKDGYRLHLQPLSGGYEITPTRMAGQSGLEKGSPLAARYTMLQARLDLETGQHHHASESLNELLPYYSENDTYLGYAANAEYFNGRWRRALQLLDVAMERTPENEDIQRLYRDIYLRHSQHVLIDHEWIKIGDSDQHVTTLAGLAFIDDAWEIGMSLQNNEIEAEGVTLIDGRVGDVDRSRQRGEIFLAHESLDGTRTKASLYGNNKTLGAGVAFSWYHELGQTMIEAEYHRPNWLFVEGVLGHANRDRIALGHQYRPNPLWLIGGKVGYNRYNFDGVDDVARTITLTGSVTRQLRESSPYLAVNYSLDGEYEQDSKSFIDQNGNSFTPLPVEREVHTGSLLYNEQFGEDTSVELQGGYSWERLGGDHGPLIAGLVNQQLFEDRLQAQLRASYGAFNNQNTGDTARVGGQLKWRF